MKIERQFLDRCDRYVFDFGACSYKRGWAQFDTRQDASYFGNWVNPTERRLFSFAEGDTCLVTCETDEEFAAEVRSKARWHAENDGKPALIDPGLDVAMAEAFRGLGLADVMHPI